MEPATTQRSSEFRSVEGSGEHTSAEVLLVSAYSVMWLLVLLFVGLMARRLRAMALRLAAVEEALNQHERGTPQ